LSATEKAATNQLVLDLKANSLWTPMKAIYPMVGASAAACAQNLKSSSFTGTFNGGITYASTGIKPNGTSGFLNTNLHMRNNTSLNNVSYGAYWRDWVANTDNKYYGGYDASGVNIINQKTTNADNYVNSFTSINISSGNGLHGISRISATENVWYRNNTNQKGTSNSSTIYNGNFYFASNNNLSVSGFQPWEIAFAYISEGFTDTGWTNFYTSVQAFQTTLSRQV